MKAAIFEASKEKIIKERRITMGDAGAGENGDEDFEAFGPAEEGRQAISPEGFTVGGTPIGGKGEEEGTPALGVTSGDGRVTSGDGREGGPPEKEKVAPRAWEKEAEEAQKVAEKKRARRRSILSTEEGGLLSSAPLYRRSILGA